MGERSFSLYFLERESFFAETAIMSDIIKASSSSSMKFKFKGDKVKKKKKKNTSITTSSTDVDSAEKVAIISTTIVSAAEDSEDEFLTSAQLAQKRKAQAKETDIAKAKAAVSYRDRINEFNNKLAAATEHNDIPRVSAAGNG